MTPAASAWMTDGQRSLLDEIHALLDEVGTPADLDVLTGSVSPKHAKSLADLRAAGKIRTLRLVVDGGFLAKRESSDQPAHAEVDAAVGRESVRVVRTHAKAVVARGSRRTAALICSANLNINRSAEFFERVDGVAGTLQRVVDGIWSRVSAGCVGHTQAQSGAALRAAVSEFGRLGVYAYDTTEPLPRRLLSGQVDQLLVLRGGSLGGFLPAVLARVGTPAQIWSSGINIEVRQVHDLAREVEAGAIDELRLYLPPELGTKKTSRRVFASLAALLRDHVVWADTHAKLLLARGPKGVVSCAGSANLALTGALELVRVSTDQQRFDRLVALLDLVPPVADPPDPSPSAVKEALAEFDQRQAEAAAPANAPKGSGLGEAWPIASSLLRVAPGFVPQARPLATTADLRSERARLRMRESLGLYLAGMWTILHPGTPQVASWAGDAICDHMQAWILGQIDRLSIEVPPGAGKTSRAVAAVCYGWEHDPSKRYMCGSYDLIYAARLNRRRRRVVLDRALRELMRTEYELLLGEKASTFFQNDRGGWMAAISPDGGVTTGEHCDGMLLDDLCKPANATERKFSELRTFITETLLSRFRDQNNPRIMNVQQRLGDHDPAGVLYESFNDFEVLCIPAEYDPHRSKVSVLGFKDPRTKPGASFFEDRYGKEHLESKRKAMGSDAFDKQYNQKAKGAGTKYIFMRHWFRFWQTRPDLAGAEWAAFIDCTFDGGPTSDYVVIQVWASVDARAYLMDQMRAQMSLVETCAALGEMAHRWPQCGRWLVEAQKKANGDGVVDVMSRLVPGVVGVTYERGQSKAARARAASPMLEAGQVYVPDPSFASWVPAFLAEVCSYTGQDGEQDDQVDGMSGGLNFLRGFMLEGLRDFSAAQVVRVISGAKSRKGGW